MRPVRVIRTGATRTVILIGPWAIKIPTGRGVSIDGKTVRGRLAGIAHGILANHAEYIWSNSDELRGKVTPVLHSWLGGVVQVYPRCDPLPAEVMLPPLPSYVGDVKPDNYGVWRGRVLRLDYDVR